MTIKEAILKSLEDIQNQCTYLDVYKHIAAHKYYDFGSAKTPASTISALLGDFIRKGDTRVKRITQPGGTYSYYLSKNEGNVDIASLVEEPAVEYKASKKSNSYAERDLHLLLSSYLKSSGIYSKTIFHEQSQSGKDNNQIWTHPDMVGLQLLTLNSPTSRNFMKSVKAIDTLKLSSYELKREINSDSELKKAFFQAVSNSSWANYGYLVAFQFSDFLKDEMKRLNQSFGIGIIQLNGNPFESKELLPSKYRELDIKTIDKLCRMNKEFETFIEQTEKLLTSEERYYKSSEKELDEFCDRYFTKDEEAEKYCKEKNIPIEAQEV